MSFSLCVSTKNRKPGRLKPRGKRASSTNRGGLPRACQKAQEACQSSHWDLEQRPCIHPGQVRLLRRMPTVRCHPALCMKQTAKTPAPRLKRRLQAMARAPRSTILPTRQHTSALANNYWTRIHKTEIDITDACLKIAKETTSASTTKWTPCWTQATSERNLIHSEKARKTCIKIVNYNYIL